MMAGERSAQSFVPEKMYCVDNGSMIAILGRLQLLYGEDTELRQSAINQHLRTNETPILWS
jgi:tRNA A37 threonylcarbamoyltransferase TsaD